MRNAKKKFLNLLLISLTFSLLASCQKPKPIDRDSESESEFISESEGESTSESEGTSESESEQDSEQTSEVPSETDYGYNYYNNYYGELTWNNGEDLKNKLHAIISSGITKLKYDGNWATNQNADQALDDFEMVDVIYSNDNDYKTNTYNSGKGWQREHAYAASLMTGFSSSDAVNVKGRATDFHNLFASSNSGNTSRGNKNFGNAIDTGDNNYQDFGHYKCDNRNFEPIDSDKGKVTRAIFYMCVMYNTTEEANVPVTLTYSEADKETYGKSTATVYIPVTYKPLEVVEEYVSFSKYTYTQWYYKEIKESGIVNPEKTAILNDAIETYGEGAEGYSAYTTANCQYKIGNLSTLLNWNNQTVDYLEYQHNEFVYSGENQQGNRNPFVDYPELVDYIFGNKKNESGDLRYLKPTYLNLNMDKDEINHYAIQSAKREYDEGATFSKTDYTIVGVKNNLSTIAPTYSDSTPDYTFTKSDAEAGSKKLVINTPINNINLDVVVNKGSLESCSNISMFVGSTKTDFSNGGNVNKNGVDWKVSWTNEKGEMGSNNNTWGMAFGVANGGKTMHELVFETTSEYTVDKVYFKGSCAANKTINYTIMVGETIISSGSITRTPQTVGPETVGDNFTSLTGKIKFIINGTGASEGAIYVYALAFNQVN